MMNDFEPGDVVGGVDTHSETHVAAVVDHVGRILGAESFRATAAGYRQLLAWLQRFGELRCVGIEGTGAYGAGLQRFMGQAEIAVSYTHLRAHETLR